MNWIGWVFVALGVIVCIVVILTICAMCVQSGHISRWEEERDRQRDG